VALPSSSGEPTLSEFSSRPTPSLPSYDVSIIYWFKSSIGRAKDKKLFAPREVR
jgi:hypothetical protein